jgi:hypothetical protein
MQPVHSEGQHFFNATPYGIREIFKLFPEGEVSWEGSFSDLIAWVGSASGVEARATESEYSDFISRARALDQLVTYEKLMYIASGVWFDARKPS